MWDDTRPALADAASCLAGALSSLAGLGDPFEVMPHLGATTCRHTRRDPTGAWHAELLPAAVAARLLGRETHLCFLHVQECLPPVAAAVRALAQALDAFDGSITCHYHVIGPDAAPVPAEAPAPAFHALQLRGSSRWCLRAAPAGDAPIPDGFTAPGAVLFVPAGYTASPHSTTAEVAVQLVFEHRPPRVIDLVLDALRRGTSGAPFGEPVLCPDGVQRDWPDMADRIGGLITALDHARLVEQYEPEDGGDGLRFLRRYSAGFAEKLEEGRLRGYVVEPATHRGMPS